MASPSPSEFLTFYRRLTTHPALRRGVVASVNQTSRPLTTSIPRYGYGKPENKAFPDEQHTTQKTDRADVQNDSSHAGKEAHVSGTGGIASSRRDDRENTARAKKEFPEAPDVIIGMQDERGAKGH